MHPRPGNSARNLSVKNMQEKHKTPPHAGFNLNLGDIYHVLFRHKWKILIVWTLGILASAGCYLFWPVPYSSEAVLFVRYVQDVKPLTSVAGDPDYTTAMSGADSVMNAEIEILRTLDVAREAAGTLSPDVLAKLTPGTTNTDVAAEVIRAGLQVVTFPRNPNLHVFFKQGNWEILQPVLSQVIASYLEMHKKAHHVGGKLEDNLAMTTLSLKADLSKTEQELRELQKEVNVTSLSETKKMNAEMKAKIEEELWAAETELKVHLAVLNAFTNSATAKIETNTAAPQVVIPDEKISEYKEISQTLEDLQKRKRQLLLTFERTAPRVQTVLTDIDKKEKIKSQLESEYPRLKAYEVTTNADGNSVNIALNIALENNAILGLTTKIASLNERLQEVNRRIEKVAANEETIRELQRDQATKEERLAIFEREGFKSRTEEALNNSSIEVIQKPSPPARDPSKLKKIVRVMFLGTIAAGLALAFAIELYFDRSFKRPIEVETKLGLPLFLSIPETTRNGKHLLGAPTTRLLAASNGNDKNEPPEPAPAPGMDGLTPWKPNRAMQPFFEALRDRLITHFELKEVNHKPKLVAVTSCDEGSGVSTVASGLAASLSETGEGNVLLVDMNYEHGTAHFFHKGKLACGLDEVLEKNGPRENAQVEKNLFVVSENAADEKLPRILHKRFSALIPKLHASDFDYIIFDMPPVSQTSATTRVARFMDIVFMVVEAEKTDRDTVKRATNMLADAKADNVGVVLNKSHNYVPKRLHQEL